MSQPLRLFSLNIEGDQHLDTVTPFLKSNTFDVVCLQEVLNKDIQMFKDVLQMDGEYYPSAFYSEENKGGITPGNAWGILLLCRNPNARFFHKVYVGRDTTIPIFDDHDFNNVNRILAGVEYSLNNQHIKVLTTHFTWTPDGEASDQQREELKLLESTLEEHQDFVLCGDFNAPRGKEIWETLANQYTDNIPEHITTTIDQNLHKVKGLQLVVDGMFSTPKYVVENVEVIDGLSDHMGVRCDIRIQ